MLIGVLITFTTHSGNMPSLQEILLIFYQIHEKNLNTDRDDLYKSYWNTKKGEIPDGTGYGIRKKYNFAEITKEDLHEIITNIAASYNFDEASIRNWLQELGIKPGNLSGIDFAAAI